MTPQVHDSSHLDNLSAAAELPQTNEKGFYCLDSVEDSTHDSLDDKPQKTSPQMCFLCTAGTEERRGGEVRGERSSVNPHEHDRDVRNASYVLPPSDSLSSSSSLSAPPTSSSPSFTLIWVVSALSLGVFAAQKQINHLRARHLMKSLLQVSEDVFGHTVSLRQLTKGHYSVSFE